MHKIGMHKNQYSLTMEGNQHYANLNNLQKHVDLLSLNQVAEWRDSKHSN